MAADIENPEPDGCVIAMAEPSRNTFKGRLSFLGNPSSAGAGAGDDDHHHHKEASKPPNSGTGTVVTRVAAAAKPKTLGCRCGWRNCVLYVCSVAFFVVAFASMYLQKNDEAHGIKNTQHTVLACIGFVGGMILMAIFYVAVMSVGAEIH